MCDKTDSGELHIHHGNPACPEQPKQPKKAVTSFPPRQEKIVQGWRPPFPFFALDLSGSMNEPPPKKSVDWMRRNEVYKALVECLEHTDSVECRAFVDGFRDFAVESCDQKIPRGEQEFRLIRLLNVSLTGRMCSSFDDFGPGDWFADIAGMIDRYVDANGVPEGPERVRFWEHRILSLYREYGQRCAPQLTLRFTLSRDCSARSTDDVARRADLIQQMIAEAGFIPEEADEALEAVLTYQHQPRRTHPR